MNAADIMTALLTANLVGSIAILAVLIARGPIRRLAGAKLAYALWLVVPAAIIAAFLPARSPDVLPSPAPLLEAQAASEILIGQVQTAGAMLVETVFNDAARQSVDWISIAAIVWAMVAIGALVFLGVRQHVAIKSLGALTKETPVMSRASRPAAGPAVVGVIAPRIVLPANFEASFDETERKVVIAHEEVHLRGRHTFVKTVVEIAVCLSWFNPLAYAAARSIAMDQELTCDEAVAVRFPKDRKVYARALLKTQSGARLPLGCYWPARSTRKLKTRISRLAQTAPGRLRQCAGAAVVVVSGLGAGYAAWAGEPAKPVSDAAAGLANTPIAEVVAPASPGTLAPVVPPASQPQVTRVRLETPEQPQISPPAAGPETRVSVVELGKAVEIETTATLPSGRTTRSVVTTYGSQSNYRTITGDRGDRRYGLLPKVERQVGDLVTLSANLSLDGKIIGSGRVDVRSGETAQMTLSNGQTLSVKPTVRPETPGEVELGKLSSRPPQSAREAKIPSPLTPAQRQQVAQLEAGMAVDVEATATLPNGSATRSRMTTFSSRASRSGSWWTGDGGYMLLPTVVRQDGDVVTLSASLVFKGDVLGRGQMDVRSGETIQMTLDNGQILTVKPVVRPETEEETWQSKEEAMREQEKIQRALDPSPL